MTRGDKAKAVDILAGSRVLVFCYDRCELYLSIDDLFA